MKRVKRAAVGARKSRNERCASTVEDPEWDHLEERYSQFGSDDMRRLAELLILR